MIYHIKRTALIDADYLAYTIAAWAHSHQADALEVSDLLDSRLDEWMHRACASEMFLCFSCDRGTNFRREFYPFYKSHRTGEPPAMLDMAKELLGLRGQVLCRDTLEADDIMGIMQTNGKIADTVIVSRDKDMRQIPGWHLNPYTEDYPVHVSEDDADYLFYQQWLSGDPTDGFKGLPGIGPKKAQALLDKAPSQGPEAWAAACVGAYEAAGVSEEDMLAQARCARILRASDWDCDTGVIPWRHE